MVRRLTARELSTMASAAAAALPGLGEVIGAVPGPSPG